MPIVENMGGSNLVIRMNAVFVFCLLLLVVVVVVFESIGDL